VRRGHLRESRLAGERRDPLLVGREAIAVHEDDRNGSEALGARGLQARAHRASSSGRTPRRGAHALVHLDTLR
jgi:hypothetical protein